MIAVLQRLDDGQRLRAEAAGKKYGSLLAIGAAYLLVCLATGWSLPCPFHWLTGWDCPGCGATRLVLALAEGNLAAALAANPALFLASPFLAYLVLGEEWLWIRYGRPVSLPGQRWLPMALAAVFLLYGIGRNL